MLAALLLGLALPAAATSQYEPRGPVRSAKMARPLTANVTVRPGGCYLIGIEVPSDSHFSEWIDRRGLRYRVGRGERVNMESEGRFAIADLFCFDKRQTITVTIAPTECHDDTPSAGLPACDPVRLGEGALQWQVYEKYTPPPSPPKPKRRARPGSDLAAIETLANLGADGPAARAVLEQAERSRDLTKVEPPPPRRSLGEIREDQERRSKGPPLQGGRGPASGPNESPR